MSFLLVGLGGAVGAMLRYAISLIPFKGSFPLLTLMTNLIGALLIGLIAGTAVKKELSENMHLFLKTGLCGGFTTFSTFSLESYNLLQAQKPWLAVGYMALSVGVCLVGVMSGMLISKNI